MTRSDSATNAVIVPATVEQRANQTLEALRAHDMARLATLVHPRKGVRFSPYAYVHTDRDIVLTREQIAAAWNDSSRLWGEFDGSGAPMRLTFPDYYKRFVYNADFAHAPRRAVDSLPLKHGNTPSNLREAYPTARWIELHFPGFDPKYGGMDWSSIWLVFERLDADWYLVGLVHGSWTI